MHMNVMVAVLLLLAGGLHAADEGGRTVDPVPRQRDGSDKRIRIEGADLQSLWRGYLAGEEAYCALGLSILAPAKVPEELDAEICGAFASSQTVYRALFLGLCESLESLKLLESALTNGNATVRDEARMALARRGNREYEEMFIRRYASHPIATNLTPAVARDKSTWAVVRPMLYIGSVACVAALFDSIPPREYARDGVRVSFVSVADMRTYLAAAGIEIPEEGTSDEKMRVWWRSNRAAILAKLRAKDPKTLPRLSVIGICVSIS